MQGEDAYRAHVHRRREIILGVLVLVFLVLTLLGRRQVSANMALAAYHDSIADVALDSIEAVRSRWVADTLVLHQLRAEQAEVDAEAEAEIGDLEEGIATDLEDVGALADSIRAEADSSVAALVDTLEARVVQAVARGDSIARAKDEQIAVRDRLIVRQDSTIASLVLEVRTWETRDAARDDAQAALNAEISRLNSRSRWLKAGLVVEGLLVVYTATR